MEIKKTIELGQGKVQFEGTLEGAELDVVIQTGLLVLLRQGVISSTVVKDEEIEGEVTH